MAQTRFIEGPAGAGKTTFAIQYLRDMLDQGVNPERIFVLVPQPALGRPYQRAFAAPGWPGGAQTEITTLGTLARQGLEMFWPLVVSRAGFANPRLEPEFLTIETAQYYMARFVQKAVRNGAFDSVSVTPFRIMSQILDNLTKSAVNRFPLEETAGRLIAAWGDRHSSRLGVYQAALDIALEFREHCRKYSLLDFAFQIELYMEYLLTEPLYQRYFRQRYAHLVADNLEENVPAVGDFIRWVWPDLESALLLYDTDAGYRLFLGADPKGMHRLDQLCEEVLYWHPTADTSPALQAAAQNLALLLESPPALEQLADTQGAFSYEFHRFYPEMIDWVAATITNLVKQGVPPREMVVLAPLLGDSLRFSLMTQLEERGIKTVSHRPSRSVRDEPAARAMLALAALAHPAWGYRPPMLDVANALQQVIEGLDPVRAWLLAQIVYKPNRSELGAFDAIEADIQTRITFRAGERYERLREWLTDYTPRAGRIPPDHFVSRLFGEVLSQPGYGFHTNLDAGRVVAELVESARKFRHTLYPNGQDDWNDVTFEYFSLVQDGLLAGLSVSSWRDEEQDAVFVAPAHTFLMRNRQVDYQFWLDAGSNYWWERLEQPLTHPYVLARDYPPHQVWTDEMEFVARQDALRRLVLGLVRRCRKHIFVSIANLGEQGFEQRGPMLQVFQQLIRTSDDREGTI